MSPEYPLDFEPATPEYVLEVLRESVRLLTGEDDLRSDWRAWDLVDAYSGHRWPTTTVLAESMNSTFDVQISLEEWKQAFPKLRGRTVREVCEFLAPRVRRPVIRPWRFMAHECLPAGVFLALRSLLPSGDGSRGRITPSSCTDSLPFTDLCSLFWRLNLIAPGRLAPPQVRGSLVGHHLVGVLGTLWLLLGSSLGFVLAVLGFSTGSLVAAVAGLAMLATGIACGWVVRRVQKPPYVWASWPEYPIFRDLAYAVAGQEPRRRLESTS